MLGFVLVLSLLGYHPQHPEQIWVCLCWALWNVGEYTISIHRWNVGSNLVGCAPLVREILLIYGVDAVSSLASSRSCLEAFLLFTPLLLTCTFALSKQRVGTLQNSPWKGVYSRNRSWKMVIWREQCEVARRRPKATRWYYQSLGPGATGLNSMYPLGTWSWSQAGGWWILSQLLGLKSVSSFV